MMMVAISMRMVMATMASVRARSRVRRVGCISSATRSEWMSTKDVSTERTTTSGTQPTEMKWIIILVAVHNTLQVAIAASMPDILFGAITIELFRFKSNFLALVVVMTLLTKVIIRQVLRMVASSNDGSCQTAIASVATVDEGALFLGWFLIRLLLLFFFDLDRPLIFFRLWR